MGVFDNIFIYTEASLPLEFVEYFKDKFYTTNVRGERISTRGFGYWCWKPRVILMALEQIQEGDLLLYCDIGFEFNAKAKETMQELFSDIEANEIMGCITNYPEKCWNKADLLAHFGLLENQEFLESGQCAAGIVLLKKTQKTIQIIKEWLEAFEKHFELIDDSPSTIPNLPYFRENRHDQSVWSVLNKKYKIKNYPYEKWFDQNYSVLYNRNKIYLPALVEQTKELNEMIRGAWRYSFQWNPKVYQRGLEQYANAIFEKRLVALQPNLIKAKHRIHNHLAYKLGSAMILNSKSLWGYIRMPYVLSYIKETHRKEIADYEARVAKNPSLKLPPLESYTDYKQALKEKECFTYKLGKALITANSVRGGGRIFAYLAFFQEVRKLKKEFRGKHKDCKFL